MFACALSCLRVELAMVSCSVWPASTITRFTLLSISCTAVCRAPASTSSFAKSSAASACFRPTSFSRAAEKAAKLSAFSAAASSEVTDSRFPRGEDMRAVGGERRAVGGERRAANRASARKQTMLAVRRSLCFAKFRNWPTSNVNTASAHRKKTRARRYLLAPCLAKFYSGRRHAFRPKRHHNLSHVTRVHHRHRRMAPAVFSDVLTAAYSPLTAHANIDYIALLALICGGLIGWVASVFIVGGECCGCRIVVIWRSCCEVRFLRRVLTRAPAARPPPPTMSNNPFMSQGQQRRPLIAPIA